MINRGVVRAGAAVFLGWLTLTACGGGSAGAVKEAAGSATSGPVASAPLPHPAGSPPGTPTADASVPAGLQARWLTWVASQPDVDNPVSDPTGEFCARGQTGDLWLVAGTFGGTAHRTCTVPAGRTIAGPLLNLWNASRADCTAFLENAHGQVLVDGSLVEVTRIDPESVSFTGVADNAITGRAGTTRTVSCGLWFAVPPLAPGDHNLTITGTAAGGFSLHVEYALTVTG